MKKLGILVGVIACALASKRTDYRRNSQTVVNNYYLRSGCSGKCNGHCHEH